MGKFFNGKVICTRGYEYPDNDGMVMRKGAIYEIIDGEITYENGEVDYGIESVAYYNERYIPQIMPYSEPTLKEKYLQVGNVVKLRDEDMAFVLPDRLVFKNSWGDLQKYNDSLESIVDCSCDIIEIFKAPIKGDVAWVFGTVYNELLVSIWKREEKSAQQLEIERIENEMRKLSEAQNKLADELSKVKNGK